MKKRENQGIDIEIDELTNSIKNVISGDSFPTDITRITKLDNMEYTDPSKSCIKKIFHEYNLRI